MDKSNLNGNGPSELIDAVRKAAHDKAAPATLIDKAYIAAKYGQQQVTSVKDIPVPVPIIKMDGQTICTSGNNSTISGIVKSGKSAVIGAILAGAIKDDGCPDGFARIAVAKNEKRHAIIHIDSEQSEYDHQRNIKTVLKRAQLEKEPAEFLSFNSRGMSARDAAKMVDDLLCCAVKESGGVFLLLIDGIADFIDDVNDPTESKHIVDWLLNISKEYNTVVLTVIHTNPGSDKERGHLGSNLLRKSESILTITKDGDVSSLATKYMRSAANMPPVQFIYDTQKGYHIECDAQQYGSQPVRGQTLSKLKDVADNVFAPPVSLSYDDAIAKICRYTNRAPRTAKETFKDIKALKLIVQSNDGNWRTSTSNL